MTEQELRDAIREIGPGRVIAMVSARGWPAGAPVPDWVWEQAVEACREERPND